MFQKNCFERIFRLDSIRLFKLFEIVYYTIISFIITLIVGKLVENDNYMPYIFKTYDYEKVDKWTLLKDILVDLTFLSIFLYYLKKTLNCIPFIFSSLNKKYIPSMKGEIITGVGLGSGIILYTSLHTIKDKISVFDSKIKDL